MDQDYLKRRVTIYQVAKESGYSLATVSRVINNKENVTEETKIKVMEVIEKLGYKPSAIAQGLAKSKSTNVGIVIPNSMHMYVASMLSGMVDIAKIYGFQTTLFTTTQNTEEVSEVVESIISSNVDGVVVFDDAHHRRVTGQAGPEEILRSGGLHQIHVVVEIEEGLRETGDSVQVELDRQRGERWQHRMVRKDHIMRDDRHARVRSVQP